VIAINQSGEAQISSQMQVFEIMEKDAEKQQYIVSKASYDAETIYQDQYYTSKPVFLHGLSQDVSVQESKNLHLEARLEQACQDVQWYFNNKSISIGKSSSI